MIYARIANRRKNDLQSFARAVVNHVGAVFVGNISSPWQITSGAAKAALDVSGSMLRTFLDSKRDHAGVAFAEVDEAYTTQSCSECGVLSGPQGRESPAIRQWVCSNYVSVHDRDQNAALNIARLRCETLGPKGAGSLGV
jgi:putative transposase